MQKHLLVLAFFLLLVNQAPASIWDLLRNPEIDPPAAPATPAATFSLSTEEVTKGLLEALAVGAKRAVALASAEGGFLNDPRLHIPLPPNLQAVADKLRFFGLSRQLDNFEYTLNVAAEQASGEALPILTQAIREMRFADAKRLWKGGDTALTDYFREKTSERLYDRYLPVVQSVTQKAGVTSAYQALVSHPAARMVAAAMDMNTDVDGFVTDQALAGIYTLLAAEEKQIRANPAARTTALLKKVFGH